MRQTTSMAENEQSWTTSNARLNTEIIYLLIRAIAFRDLYRVLNRLPEEEFHDSLVVRSQRLEKLANHASCKLAQLLQSKTDGHTKAASWAVHTLYFFFTPFLLCFLKPILFVSANYYSPTWQQVMWLLSSFNSLPSTFDCLSSRHFPRPRTLVL